MESWREGREAAITELNKAFDIIGANLKRELDHGNSVLIPRHELQRLREQDHLVGELEDEILNLKGQYQTNVETFSTAPYDKDNLPQESEFITENARLVQELEIYRNAASNVDNLQEENLRLATELKQALEKVTQVTAQYTNEESKRPTGEGTTTPQPDSSSFESVSGTVHQALVRKYNSLCTKYFEMNSARESIAKLLKEQKVKTYEWKTACETEQQKIGKLKAKMQSFGEELRSLKAMPGAIDGLNESSQSRDPKSIFDASAAAAVSLAKCPIPPDLNEYEMPCTPSFPGRSKTKKDAMTYADDREWVQSEDEHLDKPLDSIDLPPLPREVNVAVEDTQFDDLEFHPSYNQDETTSRSPNQLQDHSILVHEPLDTGFSPDIPVVVSTRKVKKRKTGNASTPKESGLPKIKIEEISSSPLRLTGIFEPSSDSIDLDAIGDKQETPRKQRSHTAHEVKGFPNNVNVLPDNQPSIDFRATPNYINTAGHTLATTRGKRPDPALRSVSTNKRILPITSVQRLSKRRRTANQQETQGLIEDAENLTVLNENMPGKNFSSRLENLDRSTTGRHAIKNLNLLPKTTLTADATISAGQTSKDSYGTRPSLSTTSSPNKDRRADSFAFARKQIKRTADSDQAVSRSSPLSRPPSKSPINKLSGLASENKASVVTPKGMIAQRQSVAAADRFNAKVDCPDNEPLRHRPLEKLSLEDFKVNPKYNQGYRYAFNEVVRNKDDRRCLPGCTKPECCGDRFRVLAELERDPGQAVTLSQEEADQALLEEFLGGNVYKLKEMPNAERVELLLQARTRQIANKFGRHRQAYQRAKSPIGFWRIDFPTTQEEIEDREQARLAEREKVEYRYHEAMRPGGAFIFKDE
ncbi:DNA repair protein endonuclease SAE2/CtIP C-terminus-domain-containing protein [Bisporella sp. PMI_857]|nr:DNA repair protein endonuclease SAE2/CtIP C-terminus-domain-containing protein [Bisporella sp. PMI_857]